MNAVVTRNLEVRYDRTVALSEVTVDVPIGTSLAVVGANGSGKSTLLGALAGIYKPATGSAWTVEKPALVLQATEVDNRLPITVLDAVRLGRYPSLGLFRRFGDADNGMVDDAMRRMNIMDLREMPLSHLSGGQRQRVLMAQGLAQQSKVLLLDEPMTGLDITSRQVVLDVIADETTADRTVIMTTHSLSEARVCDQVLLLDTRPVALGPPSEVLTESNLLRVFRHAVVQVGATVIGDDHHGH